MIRKDFTFNFGYFSMLSCFIIKLIMQRNARLGRRITTFLFRIILHLVVEIVNKLIIKFLKANFVNTKQVINQLNNYNIFF